MKKILLCVACFVLWTTALGQNGSAVLPSVQPDTIPFLLEHHVDRLERFRSEPVLPGAIVFLGNSITEGGNWRQLTGNDKALNRGIGGDITFGVLRRLDEVLRHKPSRIFLLIGINDLAKEIPEEVVAVNCRKIIERVQRESPQTVVYLQSILPLNPRHTKFPARYHKTQEVVNANKLLRDLASDLGVVFIDLSPVFSDEGQFLIEELTYDGLHLNQKGYEKWRTALMKMNVL